ncbi:hypothetical protein [Burkholderia vietnamiensis]|uniref:hypothetical protein n=1 Tax=Burkholderia vietnamiensis TaxID=60552 RepID=UPI00075EC700|nr:hypothetical protein [Burkholderia vietnamiensis]KVS17552.1 hypothetical protein WK32_03265 [Burkholderia vietnamiensis]
MSGTSAVGPRWSALMAENRRLSLSGGSFSELHAEMLLTGCLKRLANSLAMLDEVTKCRIHQTEERVTHDCIEPRRPLSFHSVLLNRNEVNGVAQMVVGDT